MTSIFFYFFYQFYRRINYIKEWLKVFFFEIMQQRYVNSCSGSGKSKWSQTESETNGVLTYWLLSEQSTGEWQFFTCQFNLCDSSQSQVEFFDDWLTYSEVIGILKNFMAICTFPLERKERERESTKLLAQDSLNFPCD